MKLIFALCLAGFLPSMAFAQIPSSPPDATAKPPPFEPVLAKDHDGMGRIGVRLAFDKVTGLPQIAAITRGSPAADFGLKVGDYIIKIDRNLTTSLSQDEVRLALHGQPGTGVELTIQRDDNPHYIVRALERRLISADSEDMVMPPLSGVANAGNLPPVPPVATTP